MFCVFGENVCLLVGYYSDKTTRSRFQHVRYV